MKFFLVGVLLLASVANLKAENEDEIEELTLDEGDLDMVRITQKSLKDENKFEDSVNSLLNCISIVSFSRISVI